VGGETPASEKGFIKTEGLFLDNYLYLNIGMKVEKCAKYTTTPSDNPKVSGP